MRTTPFRALAAVAAATALMTAGTAVAGDGSEKSSPSGDLTRGRYLIVIGGCNECHTPGYVEAGGKVAESQWLTGSNVIWQGGWGTTYPANLRLFISAMSEDAWVQYARHAVTRPPMGWFVLNALTESDARALYRFVKELGPSGGAAPPYVPPGSAVGTAVIRFPEAAASQP
jgi:mono/diheme cytochrome c family protein